MKAFRFILLAGAAILVLGVAGAIVASADLDPAKLRDTLQDSVHRATGRDLTVAGPVRLRLGLQPRFEVDDIAFANLPGSPRPQMLTAKRLTAKLALLPLLSGDAVISSLRVEDADIVLERGADGAGNWQFAPARRALFPAQAGTGGHQGGGGHHVEIRTIDLEGGKITWQGAAGAPLGLGITHLRWSSDGPDLPMTLAFAGTRGDVPVTVNATSGSLQRLQGGPVSALAGVWPLTVDVAAQGAALHLEGGISHPDQARGFQFRAAATIPALEALATLADLGSLPPLRAVTASALLSDGAAGELRSSQVAAQAGEADLGAWVPGLSVKQIRFSAPGPGQLAQLSVDGIYQALPLRLAGTAMQPDVVGTGGPIQATLTGEAAGATLSAHGTMPPALAASGLDMAVSLRAPDLAALSPLLGRTLPAAHDLSADAQIGDAGVKLRGVAVRNLVIGSSLGDAAGQVTVQWAPRAALTGTLTSRVLDLDAIAAPAGGVLPAIWPPQAGEAGGQVVALPTAPLPSTGSQPPLSPTLQPTPSPAILPLARLRNTDADLALSVAELTVAGEHLQDLQAHLQLADGKLALNPFRAQSAEGAIIGGVSLDASSDDPPVAVTLRSPAIAAASVANLLGYPGGARGTMQVDAQLSFVGQTVVAAKSSLDGHLGLAMVDGQVDDVLVQGLIGTALDTAGVPSFGGGQSHVRCLALRMDFTQGVGQVRALAADTSKLAIDGEGQVNLHDQTADLHLRPRVRLGPTEVAAPVWLHGTFGRMSAALDPVLGGGRVGMSIGGAPAGPSACAGKLALARGGLGGPMPAVLAAQPDQGLVIRKPKDLLQGLFH